MSDKWAKEVEIMNAYVDTAKTYIQLSSAGLALPVVLRSTLESALGKTDHLSATTWIVLVVAWVAFLVAVCAGALYQFAAAKYIEREIDPKAYVPRIAKHIVDDGPGYLLNVTLLAFGVGALCTVAYSALLLRN